MPQSLVPPFHRNSYSSKGWRRLLVRIDREWPPRCWLNLLERWFPELTTTKLQRATHSSNTWNENPRPFIRVKTSDEIFERLAYLSQFPDSGD
jgi:hypothetical protein